MPETNQSHEHCHRPVTQLGIIVLVITVITLVKVQPSILAATPLPRYIDEYDVPTAHSAPLALTVDRNGIVWFTESNATKLGRFDPQTQTFTEYAVPGAGDMWGITAAASGDIWLTQYSLKGSVSPGGVIEPGGYGRLIRFDPANHNFTVINVPTVGGFPFRVITDTEGRVWFTELLGDKIGSYDPSSGKLQEYPVPTQFAGPADLTFDSHGTMWFTEAYNESVANFDLQTKEFVEYHLSTIDPTQYVGSPVGISVTPDGIVWMADHGGNWIVEFNSTSQRIIRYPTHLPPPQVYPISIPNDLLLDSEGRVWFAEHGGNSIGFLDPSAQRMVEYAIPTGPISTALWIALAPDGDVWFTEWSANKIGVVHTNLPIPFSVSASEDHLNLQTGGQASLSLRLTGTQSIVGQGVYAYSWASYNPGDVNVTFSPRNESLSNLPSASTQATIAVSSSALAGHYLLALGFDAGTVRVWTMVPTDISTRTSLAFFITSNLWFIVGAIVAVCLVAFTLLSRIRGSKRQKG